MNLWFFFFFKQKTAYEMRISDWSSDVCSSDLTLPADMTVHAALRFFTEEATHRSYPVVDAEGRLVGLASRSDALRWKAGAFDENTTLTETLSDASQTTAYPDRKSTRLNSSH